MVGNIHAQNEMNKTKVTTIKTLVAISSIVFNSSGIILLPPVENVFHKTLGYHWFAIAPMRSEPLGCAYVCTSKEFGRHQQSP
jgi:p-aminobenzoyl-glutamate transporter AbgT